MRLVFVLSDQRHCDNKGRIRTRKPGTKNRRVTLYTTDLYLRTSTLLLLRLNGLMLMLGGLK